MKTEVTISMNFYIDGNISKEHIKEWVAFCTGEMGGISGSNPLVEIDFNEVADMDDFVCKVEVR